MADEKDSKTESGSSGATDDSGKGQVSEPKWKALGFDSEDAVVEALTSLTTLQSEVDTVKAARDKIAKDFQRQTTEVGQLRKKVAELTAPPPPQEPEQSDDEVLDSLGDEEAKALNAFVAADPAMKKRVLDGGKSEMAKAIKAFRAYKPMDPSAPIFVPKSKKSNQTTQSIESMIKAAFEKMNQQKATGLPGVSQGGSVASPAENQETKPKILGSISADFFKAQPRT